MATATSRLVRLLLALPALLALPSAAAAAGTAAGTDITNQATATYTVGTQTLTGTSNVVTTRVAEILDVTVSWQDAADVLVQAGDVDRILTFRVTNTGNGTDDYSLAGVSTLGGDDFDPIFKNLYLDANANGVFDPGTDAVYVSGANDPVLAPDSFVVVFAANDIPGTVLDADIGHSRLDAVSNTGSGAPGTVIAGGGELGTDAVVGSSGGDDEDTGTYAAASPTVSIAKSVAVTDPFGGTEPVPGAVLAYSLDVSASGTGTALGVTITDPVPANTTYVPGSLMWNAAPLTDSADADSGDVGATTPGAVTVRLGNLGAATPPQTVTFEVTID